MSEKENNARKEIVPIWVLVICGALALAATAELPYSYYQVLRWVVFVVASVAALEYGLNGQVSWAWALGLLAIAFFPFADFGFSDSVWMVLDAVAGLILFLAAFSKRASPLGKIAELGRWWKDVRLPPPLLLIQMAVRESGMTFAGLVFLLMSLGPLWLIYENENQDEFWVRIGFAAAFISLGCWLLYSATKEAWNAGSPSARRAGETFPKTSGSVLPGLCGGILLVGGGVGAVVYYLNDAIPGTALCIVGACVGIGLIVAALTIAGNEMPDD